MNRARDSHGIEIRDATVADMAAIQEIYAHHVLHGLASFEYEPPDVAEMTRRYQEIVAAGYPYLVAASASESTSRPIAGYAYAGSYRHRPGYRYTVENSLYIAPERQREGIGQRLVEALIARCEAQGFRLMVAVIGDSANAASIGLHRRLGFSLVGTLDAVGYKFDRWVDSVIMQRPLGPGATAPPGW